MLTWRCGYQGLGFRDQGVLFRVQGLGELTVIVPLQALALALAVPSLAVQQPAETRRSNFSARKENASRSAKDARGKTAGTPVLLLFAVGVLLLRGVTASGTGVSVKAISLGEIHTCAIVVRKCPIR